VTEKFEKVKGEKGGEGSRPAFVDTLFKKRRERFLLKWVELSGEDLWSLLMSDSNRREHRRSPNRERGKGVRIDYSRPKGRRRRFLPPKFVSEEKGTDEKKIRKRRGCGNSGEIFGRLKNSKRRRAEDIGAKGYLSIDRRRRDPLISKEERRFSKKIGQVEGMGA